MELEEEFPGTKYKVEYVDGMTGTEMLRLIEEIRQGYYNTNQDTDLFAPEFFYIVGEIMNGNAPIELEFLLLKEMKEVLQNISITLEEFYEEHLSDE